MNITPAVWKESILLSKPSNEDKTADIERFKGAFKDINIKVPFSLFKPISSLMKKEDCHASVTLCAINEFEYRLIALNQGEIYGIAFDIGSTNICARLVDLNKNETVLYAQEKNPQVDFGADILSRMFYAMTHGGAILHKCLIDCINNIIERLLSGVNARYNALVAVVFAGNTVMSHFLMDLPVENIPISPYVPVVHTPGFLRPSDIGLCANPEALVYVFPNVGSYVGGDTVAGILSTGIYVQNGVHMLIDAGTNVEVVIGNNEWLLVGAGAAGPAYDEGIAAIGKGAYPGAISNVSINPKTLKPSVSTIGDVLPIGICGSGMISLIAELYKHGIINNKGVFIRGQTGVISAEEGSAFLIYNEHRQFLVYEYEIENFMSSKAAMLTMVNVMAGAVGMSVDDMEKIIITGALGNGIKLEHAKTIGLLPPLHNSKFIAVENAALEGAELLLKNRLLFGDIYNITKLITYKEMNEDQTFMNEFPAAKFIPI
ncbi:MAG: ASKHA domain-containing protein [Candidatus Magnetoovum sp. WYHC-5]|nr:ASKHA domain-containing protein [Candidatus Magnetoovum sp. WYHC-5]